MKLEKHKKQSIRLPKSFVGYFWDSDFKALDMTKYRHFIIERLLEFGGLDALVWILKNVSHKDVIHFLKSKKKHTLDRRSYLFWTHITTMKGVWKIR